MNEKPDKAVKDWAQVVEKIAVDRDRSAFALFFDHFAPKVKAFSQARQPGSHLLADDLVQEVMLKVWDKAYTYKAELASPSTWLFTLTRNCQVDMIRRAKNRVALKADDLWYEDDHVPDPFAALQQQRSDGGVRESLEKLPGEQLQVLTKVYIQGRTQQQAAEELGLPLGTVKSRTRLAFKKLEGLLRSQS